MVLSRRLWFLLFFLLTFVLVTGVTTTALAQDTSGKVIVVLKDSVGDSDSVVNEHEKSQHFVADLRFGHVLKGYAARISKAGIEHLKNDPRVAFISEDKEVSIARNFVVNTTQTVPTGVMRLAASSSAANKGAGATVAVVDTGINLTHPDLAANIIAAKSCISNKTANDDNGHGSHVAGTIAAIDNNQGVVGVAPQAKLVAVKVLNSRGSGTWSQVICGLDWISANAAKYNIKVANMSLGGGGSSDNNCGNTNSDALHKAICKARDAGVTFTVAAGNSGADTSTFVPAAYDDTVITVSALADSDGKNGGVGAATPYGTDDTFASFSNFGSAVDLGAPGVNIYSTYKSGGYATLSGTSMASPHVAGAAALYLAKFPGSSWTQVRDGLKSVGEVLGSGHTDPSGKHPENVVSISSL